MANKRITQLTELTSGSLSSNDLFVVVDVDAISTPTGETKTIKTSEYFGFLQDSGIAISSSYSTTASYALSSATSISSSYALSASYSLSADNTLRIVDSPITLQVTSSGNDATGDESSPFSSLEGSFKWLQSRRIVSGGFVTVTLGNEEYSYSTHIDLHHPDGNLISVKGNNGDDLTNHASATITGVSYTAPGNFTGSISISSTFTDQAKVGDYILITDMVRNQIDDTAQNNQERALCGVWKILTVAFGTLTVAMPLQGDSAQTYSVNSADVYLIKTKLKFDKCSGIIVSNGHIKSIENMVLIGINQTLTADNGGDGLSVGKLNNRFDESSEAIDNTLLQYRLGTGSTTAKLVGATGFAYAGFASRQGHLSCLTCCSSLNQNGFLCELGSMDANHCVASANTFAGFHATSGAKILARFSNSSFNRQMGYYCQGGSFIDADSKNNYTKCTFAGKNGNGAFFAVEKSNIYARGTYIEGITTETSYIPNPAPMYTARDNSVVNADFSYCSIALDFIDADFNSSVSAESAYAIVKDQGIHAWRGSSVSIGNSVIYRSNALVATQPLIDINFGSKLFCAGSKIEKLDAGAGATSQDLPVIWVRNQSVLSNQGYYTYDSDKVRGANVVARPSASLEVNHDYLGPAILCDGNSSAHILELTSSIYAGEPYHIESTYGSLIRVYTTPSSSLKHYPDSALPHDVNLSMVRFGNMT